MYYNGVTHLSDESNIMSTTYKTKWFQQLSNSFIAHLFHPMYILYLHIRSEQIYNECNICIIGNLSI